MRARASTLVIHPGALGDVLSAVPALRALRSAGPVTFSGQSRFGDLLRGLGLLDDALSFEGLGLSALFTREPMPSPLAARLVRFDRVISWFGAGDVTYRERLAAVAREAVIASPIPGPESTVPVWRHLLATVGAAASSPVDVAPLEVPATWRDAAAATLERLGVARDRPLLVVHPGAGGAWKRWPVDDLARLIGRAGRETDAQTLIHRGPADRDAALELERALGERVPTLAEPELPLLAGVLGHASVYLGSDSGVSHLAAAVGARAIIRFPAATHARWIPWSPTARACGAEEASDLAPGVLAAVSAALRAATSASR